MRRTPGWKSPGPGRSPRRESRRRPGRGPAGTSFWGNLFREVRGRPAQDFVLLLEQLVAFTQLPKLRRLARRGTGPDPVIDVGDLQPALQTRLGDPEVLRDLRDRRVALTGDRDHVTSELGRERFRHDRHPPSEDPRPHRSGVNRTGSSPMLSMLQRAREQHVGVPGLHGTDYLNTIPPELEPPFPGDEGIERRIRAHIRWN